MAAKNPGGGAPPKVDCPRCGGQTTKGAKWCDHCKEALEVVCPNTACGKKVPNFKHLPNCPHCNTPLVATPAAPATGTPANPAPPAGNTPAANNNATPPTPPKPKSEWSIEATNAVNAGKGTVRVQATRIVTDSANTPAVTHPKIWVGVKGAGVIARSTVPYSTHQVDLIDAPAGGNRPPKANSVFETNDKDCLIINVDFKSRRKVYLEFAVVGDPANTEEDLVLQGPDFPSVANSGQGFWDRVKHFFGQVKDERKFNRG